MGKVLTEDTVLRCAAPDNATAPPHGGTLSKSGTGRLKVDAQKVLTAANVGAATIADCLNDKANPPLVKCTKVLKVTRGTATKLRVDGEFVITESLDGTTDGTPPVTIAVDTTDQGLHSRLKTE
jgi:hypothetical protein